ncbi:YraN family protein [uncultured Rhodoblastus sp.]|uniref:YraN family protein n=1 Tax=uncultured Rhodoblastus sp. TaxID=543037 RepID=UPI0025F1E3CF|nr:YraN family protein [uncultured Rhodoblastus sp.]
MSRRRQKARAFGLQAESLASFWLRLKFYHIVARNVVAPGGEIDLVARRGDLIVFVEVKARPSLDQAHLAIDSAKATRISRAARYWLAANDWAAGRNFRGDAVFVAPWRRPRHVEGAVPLDIFA